MENLHDAHKHLAAGMKSLNKAIGSGGEVGVNLINLVKASGDEDNDYDRTLTLQRQCCTRVSQRPDYQMRFGDGTVDRQEVESNLDRV